MFDRIDPIQIIDYAKRLTSLTGLSAVCVLVWYGGPMLEINGARPLGTVAARAAVIAAFCAITFGWWLYRYAKARKEARALQSGLVAEAEADTDEPKLAAAMTDALATIKKQSGKRKDALYDLPWYLIIGPPGAGKTTALLHSGLRFPLAGGARPRPVAGVGGTRYCDWWFTEEAVLIDTAGRYTTQDSDAGADKRSWLAFLDLLKKSRPRQPINGALVAISLEDLMTADEAELDRHAEAIRARLTELHDRLKIDFPVYVLLTKADLIAGFSEFFGHLNESGRRKVWGATLRTDDRTRNLVGEVPAEFDALVERLNLHLPDRLQDEPDPVTRIRLFGFPVQVNALKEPICALVSRIFEPTRYHANAALRGFYFTSGTQEGTPIDRIVAALTRSFGAQALPVASRAGTGRSYFLTDLLQKVVFAEAGWVSVDPRAARRAMIIRAGAYGLIALVVALAGAAWWVSFSRNRTLIARADAAAAEYRDIAPQLVQQAVVADRDFAKVLPLLDRLRFLPYGYAERDTDTPILAGFGLSQRPRVEAASIDAYRTGLERLLRPRILYRLEERLDAARNDPGALYTLLKVYLMLGGSRAPDQAQVVDWWRRDLADSLYPGVGNAAGRQALEDHLSAMLALDDGSSAAVSLNGPLVEDAQRTLARLSLAQRGYELLRSQAAGTYPDWLASTAGGPDMALLFEGSGGQVLDKVRVPGFFTSAGFRDGLLARLPTITESIASERWVLGRLGEQSTLAAQYERLPADITDLYARDSIAAWQQMLSRLKMRPLTADRPAFAALGAAAAPTSPLLQLLLAIRTETAPAAPLARPKDGTEPAPVALAPAPAQPGASPTLQAGASPGAAIEAAFAPLRRMLDGESGRRPIDLILASLGEIHRSLQQSAADPAAGSGGSTLPAQVANLRSLAARTPPPLGPWLEAAAREIDGAAANAVVARLSRVLGEQVVGPCQRAVVNRYPFAASDREVNLAEFGALFGRDGAFDRFFAQNLAAYADTAGAEWRWRPDSPVAQGFSAATVRSFQRAAQFRDALFQNGGQVPAVALSVTPLTPSGNGVSIKLDVNGTIVASPLATGSPQALPWPGVPGAGRAAIIVTPDAVPDVAATIFGTAPSQPAAAQPPSQLERVGVWSLMRLIESGRALRQGDRLTASFTVGGRAVSYQFAGNGAVSPLSSAPFRDFRCPSGL
jgi:type VI secretion system protein ImpL